ncbi:MAG: ATP-binding cassette domain-containing protein, partial [Chloroflexi bacterium]|nr:ATP-binding cassette domain-containing protein [Chloroflexota bacterium]
MTTHHRQSHSNDDSALLKAEGLTKLFPVESGNWLKRSHSFVHAVDGLNFELGRGDSLGLVGESGCGKTTTGRLLVRLTEPTDGHITLAAGVGEPTDIATLSGKALTALRRRAQMIFQ